MDLNKIWQSQPVPAFDADEFRRMAVKYKYGRKKRFILINVLMALTMGCISLIAYWIKPEMKSTYIGLGLILLSIFLFLLIHSGLMRMYLSLDHDSATYVERLKQVQRQEEWLGKQVLQSYMLLLSAGIALYMWEYAVKLGTVGGGIAYGVTAVWVLVNWFWLRPMQLKKERTKREEVLRQAEELQRQMLDERS